MRYFMKMAAAFIGAALAANGLCYFYYSPAVQTDNPDKYTECKSEPSGHNPHGTEGYGLAIIDDNGFSNTNLFPFKEAEILCVGSSQTEAQHINWDENYVYLLNQLEPGAKVYNLGVSGQRFANSFYRIPALKEYFPACRALIFEINAMPTEKELQIMKDYMEQGEIPARDLSWKRGNLALRVVGQIPLCRLLWSQYDGSRKGKQNAAVKEPAANVSDSYKKLAGEVLALGRKQAGDTPIIIFYLSRLKIEQEGSLTIAADKGECEAMRLACQEQGITFVDMGEAFLDKYAAERLLPYGFANSKVGIGHLNAYGHKMIAETLQATLMKEGLCR